MSSLYRELIKDPDAYYRTLFAVEWLDEWAEEDQKALHEALKQAHEDNPEYMVFALSEYTLEPGSVFKAEHYKQELLRLFAAFDLELDAADVDAEGDDGMIELSVNTQDGRVNISFEQNDDWMSDEFIDFINDELLPEWDEERIFYLLPPASEVVEVVFHYPEVIDEAIEEGLIPEDTFYLEG
jgi:hypothetical protein